MKHLFFLVLLFPMQVWAHAMPTQTEPAASSVLATPPAEIVMRFTERIEPGASGIRVYEPPLNWPLDETAVTADPADPYVMRAPLGSTATGTYTISWYTLSADDGHFSNGAFTFTVGANAPQVPIQETHSHSIGLWAWVEYSAIWLELLGLALVTGMLLLPWLAFTGSTQERKKWALIGSGCVLLGTLLAVGSQTWRIEEAMSGGFVHAFALTLKTSPGVFTSLRLVLSVLLTLSFFGKTEWISWLLLLAITYFRSRVSHAAAAPFHPELSVCIHFIHLAAKTAWVGSLMAVCLTAPRVHGEDTRRTEIRLSRALLLSLAIGGVSGVYVIWLHLKGMQNMLTTEWGRGFTMLSIATVALMVLRFLHMHALRKNIDSSKRMFLLRSEANVGVVVLILSGIVALTSPPLLPHRYREVQQVEGGTIVFEQHGSMLGQMQISLIPQQKAPVKNVVVTLTNTDSAIGPIVVYAAAANAEQFFFSSASFSLPGTWAVAITAQRENAYDVNGTFTLHVPEDVQTETYGHARSLSVTSIITALALLILSAALWKYVPKEDVLDPHGA